MLESGERVDGRFEVEARVGLGGMAEVYRVRHLSLGSTHALKVLLLPHPGLRERFLREGRIQAQVRHPNVVAVTDVIEHKGRLGLLMEYVDHVSLQGWLDQQGAIPLETALQLFARVLSGVDAAHAAGILHRDLKPGNVLLARSPQGLVPKLTDFGIAKVVMDGMPAGATRDGVMMGTPGYMAPEQVRSAADVDPRADVFALGAILYTMLAGQPPFDLESPDVFQDTLDGRYAPLDTLVPDLPRHVVATVHAALDPDRDARPPTVRALAEALFVDRPELLGLVERPTDGTVAVPVFDNLAEPAPSLATYAGPLTPLNTLSETPETLAPGETRAEGARAPGRGPAAAGLVAVVSGVLALLALGGSAWLWWGRSGEEAAVVVETVATPASVSAVSTPSEPSAARDVGAATASESARSGATPSGEPPSANPERAAGTVEASAEPTPSGEGGGAEPSATSEPATGTAEAVATAPEAAPTSAPDVGVAVEVPEMSAPEPLSSPEAEVPSLKGTWTGTANGRPATLAITGQSGRSLRAELRLVLGASQRVATLTGEVDPVKGTLRLEEAGGDRLVLTGTVSGDLLFGTFMRTGQGKALAWEVRR